MKEEKHENKMRTGVLIGLAAALLAVLLVSGGMVVSQLVREKREDRAFSDLATRLPARPARPFRPSGTPEKDEPAGTPAPESGGDAPAETEPGTEEPEAGSIYDELAAENPDLFGWIAIEGTRINYPVMYTPEDPEHYLHRAFDGSRSASGVPFLDTACFEGCGNYLVYGHHMKNGTMFSGITDYTSRDFWLEHPIIQFDTLDEYGEYEVLAAFYAREYSPLDEGVFRYYRYTDLTDEAVFNEYLSNISAVRLYDTGVEAKFGDQLLTLSTCSYFTEDGRFVVVARKLEE